MTNLAITHVPSIGQDGQASCEPYMMDAMTTTRRENMPRLMGAAEAAKCLGVAQQNLRPIPGLPTPIAQLRCGSIYLAEEIEALAAAKRKRERALAAKKRRRAAQAAREARAQEAQDAAEKSISSGALLPT